MIRHLDHDDYISMGLLLIITTAVISGMRYASSSTISSSSSTITKTIGVSFAISLLITVMLTIITMAADKEKIKIVKIKE